MRLWVTWLVCAVLVTQCLVWPGAWALAVAVGGASVAGFLRSESWEGRTRAVATLALAGVAALASILALQRDVQRCLLRCSLLLAEGRASAPHGAAAAPGDPLGTSSAVSQVGSMLAPLEAEMGPFIGVEPRRIPILDPWSLLTEEPEEHLSRIGPPSSLGPLEFSMLEPIWIPVRFARGRAWLATLWRGQDARESLTSWAWGDGGDPPLAILAGFAVGTPGPR